MILALAATSTKVIVMSLRDRPLFHFEQQSRFALMRNAEIASDHFDLTDRPDNPAATTEDTKFMGSAVKHFW